MWRISRKCVKRCDGHPATIEELLRPSLQLLQERCGDPPVSLLPGSFLQVEAPGDNGKTPTLTGETGRVVSCEAGSEAARWPGTGAML